jgi:voltage-gated potassium channel
MISFFLTFYRFGRGVWAAFKDPDFEALFTLVVITLASGTVFYHNIEGWRWLDSLYFSVTTLTTVGYGDLSPHTDVGKIFTVVYLFVGIGVLLGFINTVAHHAVSETSERGIFPWRNKKS